MKKKIIFLVLFLVGVFPLFSQENIEDNKTHFSIDVKEEDEAEKSRLFSRNNFNNLFSNTDINILVGSTQFFGDIKQWDHIPAYERENNFFELKSAIEMSISKKLNHLFSVQASAITGRFGGLRREKEGIPNEIFDPYNFYQETGEYFVADFKELDLQALVNVSNILSFFNTGNNNYTIYAKAGLGYNIFNTVNRNLESGDYIYSYGYSDENQYGGLIKKSLFESPAETVYIFGAVMNYEISNKFSLLLDITQRKGKTDKWDASISDFNNVVASENDSYYFYSIGTSYRIGKIIEKEEWVTPLEGLQEQINSTSANIEWLSEDKDNDGVSDAFDKEPNTPIGVAVDGSGVSLDVDMDNIPDYLDSDPFSTRGAIVDNNGVEFDTDNDGIPDSKDLESNTEIGAIVNQYGITVSVGNSGTHKSYLPSIYFESGSSYINNSNLKRIATIAIMMNNNPNIKLLVIGNTDENGTSEFNNKLALKRSEEVINYLASNFNIDKSRFEISGNGEEKPLTKEVISAEFPNGNTLSELNRRVDFQIIR